MGTQNRFPWFRPWRWSRRICLTLGMVCVLLPMVYLLSAVPVWFLLIRFSDSLDGLTEPLHLSDLIEGVYEPAAWCGENFSVMETIYDWEWEYMIETFGPPGDSHGFH